MEPVPSTITKTYPHRGPLQQFRFAESTAFTCFRCSDTKKSKLITIYYGDWSKKLCNGCYGRLLSLFDVKAGIAPDDLRADDLAAVLLSMVEVANQRQAEMLFKTSEKRAEELCPEAVRFIATAEHVATQLQEEPQLEWSPAVIGLCKAVEAEVVARIVRPLASNTEHEDLNVDKADKDFGRIAAFCADPTKKPPELGVIAHFLQTAIHSQGRRGISPLLGAFLKLASEWTGSQWLLDPNGFHAALTSLTTDFRNRAAHIDELGKKDYDSCRDLVIGINGFLWRLVVTTGGHK
jgi:hypothetical protein